MYQVDARNSGSKGPFSGSISDPNVRWSQTLDAIKAPMVSDGRLLYLLESPNTVRAVRTEDGSQRWQTLVMGNIDLIAPPALTAESLIFGGDSHSDASNLFALSRSEGVRQWEYDTGTDASILSQPVVSEDAVVVQDDEGGVHCLSLADGTRRWQRSFGYQYAGELTQPAVLDSTVYVRNEEGSSLYALNLRDGSTVWQQTVPNYVASPVTVADGQIYLGTHDRPIVAVAAEGGAITWERSNRAFFSIGEKAIAVHDGVLFLPGGDTVLRYDPARDEIDWSFKTAARVQSPVVADETVYVGSLDGNLYAVNSGSGALRWQLRSESRSMEIQQPPVLGQGSIYLVRASNDGATVMAIDQAG